MRHMMFLGLVVASASGGLVGCDKLWAWKLVDCPLSDSRCASDSDMGQGTPDLFGVDLAGTGGYEDLAGVDLLASKPSFVSIAPTPQSSTQVLLGTNRGKVVSCELSNAQNSEGVVLDANDPGVRVVQARRFSENGPQLILAALSGGDVWKDVSGGGSGSERKFGNVLHGGWYEHEQNYTNSNTFWTVGSGGLIARRDSNNTIQGQWVTESSGTTQDLYGLVGVANAQYMSYDATKTRLYAVGANGTILERLAGTWSTVSFAGKPTTPLYGVAVYSNDLSTGTFDMATGPNDFVWAVGAQGKLVRKRGALWTAYGNSPPVASTVTLRAVWLTNTTTGLAVGDAGAVYMLGGNESSPTWTEVIPPARIGSIDPRTIHFTGVYASDFNSYYLIGTDSTVLRYQPPPTNMWQVIPCPAGQ